MNWQRLLVLSLVIFGISLSELAPLPTAEADVGLLADLSPLIPRQPPASKAGNSILLYKGIGVGLGVVAIFVFSWFVLYPTWLQSGTKSPVTLYGRFTSGAWLASSIMGWYVFRNELGWGKSGPFWTVHAWTILIAFQAVLFSGASIALWRTDLKKHSK